MGACGFLWAPPLQPHSCFKGGPCGTRMCGQGPSDAGGKKKISVCVYIFYSLLCSLNGLFEGDDGSQEALGGGTAGGHFDSNSTTGCFFGGTLGCLERWVLAWPQSSNSYINSKLLLRAAGPSSISQRKTALGAPFIPTPGCTLVYILGGISLWLF